MQSVVKVLAESHKFPNRNVNALGEAKKGWILYRTESSFLSEVEMLSFRDGENKFQSTGGSDAGENGTPVEDDGIFYNGQP